MSMWVVYDHPLDWPDWWVARRWDIMKGDNEPAASGAMFMNRTLEGLREALPPGLYCLPRFADDDPAVYEVWL